MKNPYPSQIKVNVSESVYWRLHALKGAFKVKTFNEVIEQLLSSYPNDYVKEYRVKKRHA